MKFLKMINEVIFFFCKEEKLMNVVKNLSKTYVLKSFVIIYIYI